MLKFLAPALNPIVVGFDPSPQSTSTVKESGAPGSVIVPVSDVMRGFGSANVIAMFDSVGARFLIVKDAEAAEMTACLLSSFTLTWATFPDWPGCRSSRYRCGRLKLAAPAATSTNCGAEPSPQSTCN